MKLLLKLALLAAVLASTLTYAFYSGQGEMTTFSHEATAMQPTEIELPRYAAYPSRLGEPLTIIQSNIR